MALKIISANLIKFNFLSAFLLLVSLSNCNKNVNSSTIVNSSNTILKDTLTVHVIDFKTPSPEKGKKEVYDTIAHFPKNGEWRKILMIQTIKCDAATKKDKNPCGEWDYATATNIYATHGDSIEKFQINSFMTPYGNGLNLTDNGWEHVWDVTDYTSILKGDKRIEHGNNQELHDLKFLFIKGKPSRNVLEIENVWPSKMYQYEDLALNTILKNRKIALLKEGENFRLKARISGHGHYGPYNCCEWDEKMHTYRFSEENFINWTVWKDCGHNPIYPQGGTWQFNRAGWCPGTATDTYNFEATEYIMNDSLSIDYQIEMFEENGEKDGEFRMSHQLVTYAAPNFKNDASILEIKAPNNALRYRRNIRANDGTPIINVRNEGTNLIKSITFEYGIKGKELQTYTWHGAINFLNEEAITLPRLKMEELEDSNPFYVLINTVNSTKDEQHLNNYAESTWDLPVVFEKETILKITTNDLGRAQENSYVLVDSNGLLIKERKQFPENTTFSDTLKLKPGLYTWMIKDRKQNGMIKHWWNRSTHPDKVGRNGKIQFENFSGEIIASPPFDFADYYSFPFRVQ